MALPTPECRALRRSYIRRLIERGNLKVRVCPTGALIVLNNPVIGFATKKQGKRVPWQTIFRRIPIGSYLVPRLLYLRNPKSIAVFEELGRRRPPATRFIDFGRGKLLAAYLMVEDVDALERQQEHILEEEGYGVESVKQGELATLYSILDEINSVLDSLPFWKVLKPREREEMELMIILQAVRLERAIDPNKSEAFQRLAMGFQDSLLRINTLISRQRINQVRQGLTHRVGNIGAISSSIAARRNWVRQHIRELNAALKRMIRSIETTRRFIEQGNPSIQAANSLDRIAKELREVLIVKPYHYNAFQAAYYLEQAAERLRDSAPDTERVLKRINKALEFLRRIP